MNQWGRTMDRSMTGASEPASSAAVGLVPAAERLKTWLKTRALPIWASAGWRGDGAFEDALDREGAATVQPRRLRIQPRQIYVYAQAVRLGWTLPAEADVDRALAAMDRDFLRPDGLYRTLIDADGRALDETAMIYDHAFILLALATCEAMAGSGDGAIETRAVALRDGLLAARLGPSGLEEGGPHPWQANAQMHLLEACQAWARVRKDAGWSDLALRIVDLARTRFIDRETGALYEFFDAGWRPAPGAAEAVEPGHQFEWATLLLRQGQRTGDSSLDPVARRLFTVGERGLSGRPKRALDQMSDAGATGDGGARFWPQTEWLKASLALAEASNGAEREAYLTQALEAITAVELYLEADGLWRDRYDAEGRFDTGPSPASSFYHLMAAVEQLDLAVRSGLLPGLSGMDLS